MKENQLLICKECGQPREKGRKICRACNLKRLKAMAALSYKEKGRYTYTKKCEACSEMYEANRKEQKFCSSCWKARGAFAAETISTNKYAYVSAADRQNKENKWAHRKLAETFLGRKLTCHEVVHHIDDNPKNNKLDNLLVMTRSDHVKLHKYLDDQRVIFEKSENENLRNCWNSLIIPMTTTWLQRASVKVIKLSELGQSAAEPFLNGEGSETQASGILTSNVEDEDIVQTTTSNGSGN